MSVNPVLAHDQVSGQRCPLPKPGEMFLLKRPDMYFQSGSKKAVCKATGTLHLSSMRLVFIAEKDQNRESFGSFEMPMEQIMDQKFQQPIFGCNYLELQLNSSDTDPATNIFGTINFPVYLYFYAGGAGSFLVSFHKIFAEVLRARENGLNVSGSGLNVLAQQILQSRTSFADKTDPTTFYLEQPRVDSTSLPSVPESPGEGSGLSGTQRQDLT